MIQTVPNHRQVRYPAIVSSWDGAGSRYVSCRARSSICCAKSPLAGGVSPAIGANPTALRSPPAATTSAVSRRPVRCDRRASRKRVVTSPAPPTQFARASGRLRSSPRPRSLVKPEEDLFERWLAAFEFRDPRARERRKQRLELAAKHPGHTVIFDGDLLESGDRADTIERRRPREHDLDAMRPHARELVKLPDGGEVPIADDAYAIADVLDLGQNVRRDEDRRAPAARVANKPVELLLMERVKPACRLVEDEQGGLWCEREEQRELLLVAVRVLAVLAAKIEIETPRDCLDLAVAHVAAEARDVRHDLGTSPAPELRQLARDVPDPPFQRHGVAIGVEPKDRGSPLRRMDETHQQLDRRRLPRPVRAEVTEDLTLVDGEVEIKDAVPRPVVLRESICLDRCRHVPLLARRKRPKRNSPFAPSAAVRRRRRRQ